MGRAKKPDEDWFKQETVVKQKVRTRQQPLTPIQRLRRLRDTLYGDPFNDGDPVWEEATFGLMGK